MLRRWRSAVRGRGLVPCVDLAHDIGSSSAISPAERKPDDRRAHHGRAACAAHEEADEAEVDDDRAPPEQEEPHRHAVGDVVDHREVQADADECDHERRVESPAARRAGRDRGDADRDAEHGCAVDDDADARVGEPLGCRGRSERRGGDRGGSEHDQPAFRLASEQRHPQEARDEGYR